MRGSERPRDQEVPASHSLEPSPRLQGDGSSSHACLAGADTGAKRGSLATASKISRFTSSLIHVSTSKNFLKLLDADVQTTCTVILRAGCLWQQRPPALPAPRQGREGVGRKVPETHGRRHGSTPLLEGWSMKSSRGQLWERNQGQVGRAAVSPAKSLVLAGVCGTCTSYSKAGASPAGLGGLLIKTGEPVTLLSWNKAAGWRGSAAALRRGWGRGLCPRGGGTPALAALSLCPLQSTATGHFTHPPS